MYSVSTERGTNIATKEFSYYDTPYVFSGSRNFADGKAKSELKEISSLLRLEYYFLGSSNPWKSGGYFFFGGGARYSFSKYYLENVKQFIASNPPVYFFINRGLSYSLLTIEMPFGPGGGFRTKSGWSFFTVFEIIYAYSHSRDYHTLRNLNFITDADGAGFNWRIGFGKTISDMNFTFQLTEHRLFLVGGVYTRGGLNYNDNLSNYFGKFQAHMNTKDYYFDFILTKKI